MVLVVGQSTTATTSIKLQWNSICDTNVEKYRVYFTTNTYSVPITNIILGYFDSCLTYRLPSTNIRRGNYSYIVDWVDVVGITNNSCTINLEDGLSYNMVVVSKTVDGLESEYSEELRFSTTFTTNVLPSKIEGFRIIGVR